MTAQNKNRPAPKSFIVVLVVLLIFPGLHSALAVNTGYISDEGPAPGSAKEIESHFGAPLEKKEEKQTLVPAFKERLDSLPPFWRDLSLTLNSRTYYFSRDKDGSSNNEAWALGGALDLSGVFGRDVVLGVACDVTNEESVTAAIGFCTVEFGGMDIVVPNAGIASSAPLDETSLEMWDRNMGILATGYFLVSREAFKILKAQGTGGSIVMVASKNALVASPNAAAYCTAKAAEVHLARSVALEGAPIGVRCNVVNPDAVLTGSSIWNGAWREERAAAYGMEVDELEEHYRQRSLLKRQVLPEDVAEAIYFFASDASDKSTGNILNVDAGHAPSFTR